MPNTVNKKIHYFSKRPIDKIGRTFNFIFGGRGIGKTFNCIYEDVQDRTSFIYMRRTQSEVDLIGSNSDDVTLSPFAKINSRKNTELEMSRINKNIWAVSNGYDENKRQVGLVLALSTVAAIRGFDADAYSDLIFDEFVPEKHVKKLGKGLAEGEAFLNAYETINRDREFNGRRAMRCYLLSNSNNINSPLLEILGLVDVIERMRRKGQSFVDLPRLDCTVTLYNDDDFKQEKEKTALYRLTRGTDFYEMSINNEFVYNDFSNVQSKSLKEYKPLCAIGNIYIYEHKSRCEIYVSKHKSSCPYYETNDSDQRKFYLDFGRMIYGMYVNGAVYFETYLLKEKLLEVIL